jgi:hypothetical protein
VDNVSFTSDFLTTNPKESLGFTFTGVSPSVGITAGSISSFTAAVTGNMSAETFERIPPVPEPTSLAIWGLGMGALGFAGYRRNRKRAAV